MHVFAHLCKLNIKRINQKIKRFITYRGYVEKSGRKGKIRKGW